MDAAADSRRRQAWTSYWAGGELHSCVGSYGGNYAGAIADFWESRFAALPRGGKVLDLATGNGALPLLLLQRLGHDAGVGIDAVDLALIAPSWHLSGHHPGVAFHAGVAMEALPFPDASFDLVMSQFGIEYACWPQALGEAVRVCRPDGVCAFLLHHADSLLVRVGRQELVNLDLLMAPDGLLAAAADVLPWMARARAGEQAVAGNAQALDCRQRYNRAMNDIGVAVASNPVPDLLLEARDRIHALLSSGGSDSRPQLAALDDYREALKAAALRTSEMVAHALDQTQADTLLETLTGLKPGCFVTAVPVAEEQGILGWGVVVAPRAD